MYSINNSLFTEKSIFIPSYYFFLISQFPPFVTVDTVEQLIGFS